MSPDDTRDRMIRLEADVDHITTQLADMQTKVNAMHDLLMQARGARWLIIGMAASTGFVASFAAKYLPFLSRG